MWKKISPEHHQLHNYDTNDFKALLNYVNHLATHKLGYPVSLLTYLGIVNNEVLGIKRGTLANVLLNNVGDPFKDSETSLLEVKKHERTVIGILEKFFGLQEDGARGYVTTGGTEGNFAALWWSKRFLINESINQLIALDDTIKQELNNEQEMRAALAKVPNDAYQARAEKLQSILNVKDSITTHRDSVQQLITPTVFYANGPTHYSIAKISEILRLNVRPVQPNADGSINLADFQKELLFHLGAHPKSSIIVIANIGTTITGAIDDVPGIKKILDSAEPKPKYTIHLDGALTGFVMPILKPFGEVENYFEALGVNTIAVSAHKYPGLSQPCGILMSKKSFFEKAFEKSERSIEYVGNIIDVTITGSRSGLNVLMFYNALCTLGLHKGKEQLTKMVNENIASAKYLYDRLTELYGQEHVAYPFHFNISFPRPSQTLARKYQLMLTGERATICVLPNVSRKLIDMFINELQLEIKEKVMAKTKLSSKVKGAYSIHTLQPEHMQSALDLFVRSFCDSEPITKHLGIRYDEYKEFAREVLQKAIKDGLSVIAMDKSDKVVACAIAEDITNMFVPNVEHYPKLKPVFALLEKLSEPFLARKKFLKGKIEHVWIAIVDKDHRGQGLSTVIDNACADLAVRKGFDFVYAEFTNPVSENITHHYEVSEVVNTIKYADFKLEGEQPYKGLHGEADAVVIGIKPGVKLESLAKCYIMEPRH